MVGREKAFPILNRLSGKEFLVHFAGDMPFHVDPLAFFQTNTEMAGKLVDMVYEAAGVWSMLAPQVLARESSAPVTPSCRRGEGVGADLRKNDTLVDMFCGVGTLGIACAVRLLKGKRLLQMLSGFDIYNQATLNAKANAKILGLKNKTYRFKAGDLTQPTLGATELADVIIAGKMGSCLEREATVTWERQGPALGAVRTEAGFLAGCRSRPVRARGVGYPVHSAHPGAHCGVRQLRHSDPGALRNLPLHVQPSGVSCCITLQQLWRRHGTLPR